VREHRGRGAPRNELLEMAGLPISNLGKRYSEGDYFENWLRGHLSAKGIHTFGDLVIDEYQDQPQYRYRLQVIAADVTRGGEFEFKAVPAKAS